MREATDIEKEFFRKFNIPRVWKDHRSKKTRIYSFEEKEEKKKSNRHIQLCYIDITDKILLELICIWNTICFCADDLITPYDLKTLKEDTLKRILTPSEYEMDVNKLRRQIKKLFEREVNSEKYSKF